MMKNCPNLGLQNDPASHFDIPTSANFCHKVEPAESVNRAYQEKVCLTDAYRSCFVFQQDWDGRLAPGARGSKTGNSSRTRILKLISIVAVMMLIVFGIYLLKNQPDRISFLIENNVVMGLWKTQSASPDTSATTKAPAAVVASSTVLLTKTKIPTKANTNTPANSAIVPSVDTITLTFDPTPINTVNLSLQTIPVSMTPISVDIVSTPGPQYQTPFGPQNAYLLHHISEGESLPVIADLYNTDNDMILALNAWVSELGLWPNRVIVIMPDETDFLDVKSLSVYFTQNDVTVSDFAFNKGVTIEDVQFYNQLGSDEIIPMGRWLIFPYNPETPTPSETAIPTPDLSRVLVGPFGPTDEFVLHQVALGDSMALLERLYLTSTEVIQTTNVIVGSIQVGQLLLIMPNQKEILDAIRFSVLYMNETISVEKMASKLGVLYVDLLYYNNLMQGEDIEAGRWIIYPNPDEN